ncbi:MAG: hypothetical protein ACI95R_003002, partial [Halioglobus sp.]
MPFCAKAKGGGRTRGRPLVAIKDAAKDQGSAVLPSWATLYSVGATTCSIR